jgi:hypothetical protein
LVLQPARADGECRGWRSSASIEAGLAPRAGRRLQVAKPIPAAFRAPSAAAKSGKEGSRASARHSAAPRFRNRDAPRAEPGHEGGIASGSQSMGKPRGHPDRKRLPRPGSAQGGTEGRNPNRESRWEATDADERRPIPDTPGRETDWTRSGGPGVSSRKRRRLGGNGAISACESRSFRSRPPVRADLPNAGSALGGSAGIGGGDSTTVEGYYRQNVVE